jgi:hypothetical protein
MHLTSSVHTGLEKSEGTMTTDNTQATTNSVLEALSSRINVPL